MTRAGGGKGTPVRPIAGTSNWQKSGSPAARCWSLLPNILTAKPAKGSKTAVTFELPGSFTSLAPPLDFVWKRELVIELSQIPVNPAASESSVGGICACGWRRCLKSGSLAGKRVVPSGGGNKKPFELSKGSPEIALKRPFHISFG